MQNDGWLMEGDCLEKMKDIPDGSVDMILADLPYGTTACKWDIVIPFELLWEHYERIIKQNSAIVLFGSEPFSSYLRLSNIRKYKHDWIWIKNIPTNISSAAYQPMRYSEYICVFYEKPPVFNKQLIERSESGKARVAAGKKSGVTFKSTQSQVCSNGKETKETNPEKYETDFKNPSNLIEFATERGCHRFHPTQKPVALLEYLIKTYTQENETVLDNVMGSGSTGVACVNTGRKFIGIEKEEKYFQIARERISEAILEKVNVINKTLILSAKNPQVFFHNIIPRIFRQIFILAFHLFFFQSGV